MTQFISFEEISHLRKKIRKIRRQFNRYTLQQAQQHTLFKVLQQPEIKHKHHIGIYLDAFGEIPTQALMFELFKRKKSVYLPLICNMTQQLKWQKISLQQWRSQRFALHRLGMKQAMHTRGKNITRLDTVIMPLVLFDLKGNRVGMGGGFYDRTLAYAPHNPKRIGLAHDFQAVSHFLSIQPWDQALDMVITPTQTLHFRRLAK